ncbi:glutathione S-transferase family protein [Leptolyngbya sp. FACHB-8]|nr:glutathione S-transferase family protein [Leptolyngbya sp. FACHB-8]
MAIFESNDPLVNDSEVLFESAVICEYLDEITPNSLHPQDPLTKARHRAWIEFGSDILTKIVGFYAAKDEETFEVKRQALISSFQILENQLQTAPYFAGATFSLVDAVYGPIFRYFAAFERYENFGFFAQTPKVRAWSETLLQRPSVQQAVADNYFELLHNFLLQRNSILSQRILEAEKQAA